MSAVYIEYEFHINPIELGAEILIAELGYAGFESFVETETGVLAYIQKEEWFESILNDVEILSSPEFEITYTLKEIDQINWNEEWEKNFEPIVVKDDCAVRAPFHEPFNVIYEIVIEPKMSFGTGHHETTFMMLQYILENDFMGKDVLDMGCGTAVLAILAEMKGAKSGLAIDIDDWCIENSLENVERNNMKSIKVALGDAGVLPDNPTFDIVIANINRNILLNDMAAYVKTLRTGGEVYLSGFYLEDLMAIRECCGQLGLHFIGYKERNNWIAAKFTF